MLTATIAALLLGCGGEPEGTSQSAGAAGATGLAGSSAGEGAAGTSAGGTTAGGAFAGDAGAGQSAGQAGGGASGCTGCPGGACDPAAPPDDGNDCTEDACDDQFTPTHSPVIDASACALTGGGQGQCLSGTCVECIDGAGCASHVCIDHVCKSAQCADNVQNGDETSVDCGGSCAKCPGGSACKADSDCTSARCVEAACRDWPFGDDGDLVVEGGQTLTLPAGAVRDYGSITVKLGAVLEIAAGKGFTTIGVRGDLVVEGTIRGTLGEHAGGEFSAVAPGANGSPGGEQIEWRQLQSYGGGTIYEGPDPDGFGNGRGGQSGEFCILFGDMCSGQNGPSGTLSKAGDGALPKTGLGSPGKGGEVYGQDGTDGAVDGTGGGGGARGRHGQLLYLNVAGAISGSGTIDLRGSNGGNGGKGLSTGLGNVGGQQYKGQQGGCGGGGGAGGSGGLLVLRGATMPSTVKLLLGPGQGGLGGACRWPDSNQAAEPGRVGAMGCLNTTPGLPLRCEPLSCDGLAASCGQGEDCCTTLAVPGGTFTMGADEPAKSAPAHSVTLQPFVLDKFEVTVGRFRRFVENADIFANKYHTLRAYAPVGAHPNTCDEGLTVAFGEPGTVPSGRDETLQRITLDDGDCDASTRTWTAVPVSDESEARPMNCVDWYTALAFCLFDGGRLPTEAEWELTAGGANGGLYPWGSEPQPDASLASFGCESGAGGCLLRVGSKPLGSGVFGQSDLAGNVSEWVFDRYEADWYARSETEAECAAKPDTSFHTAGDRVLRGGSAFDAATALTRVVRANVPPNKLQKRAGFRCAR